MAVGNCVSANASLYMTRNTTAELTGTQSFLIAYKRSTPTYYSWALRTKTSFFEDGVSSDSTFGPTVANVQLVVANGTASPGGKLISQNDLVSWDFWVWVFWTHNSSTGAWTCYWKYDTDDAWTTGPAGTDAGTATPITLLQVFGDNTPAITTGDNSRMAKVQVWNSTISTATALAQTKTRSAEGTEFFYNAFNNATNCHVDQSGNSHNFTPTGTGLTIPGDSPLFNTDLATDEGSILFNNYTFVNQGDGIPFPYTVGVWIKQDKPVSGQQMTCLTFGGIDFRIVNDNYYKSNTDDLGVSAVGWHYLSFATDATDTNVNIRIFDINGNINCSVSYAQSTGPVFAIGNPYVYEGFQLRNMCIDNLTLNDSQMWAQAQANAPLQSGSNNWAYYPFNNQATLYTDTSGHGHTLNYGIGSGGFPIASPLNPYTKPVYYGRGNIAYSVASGTDVSPPYPTNTSSNKISAGDKLIMFVGQKPSAANSGTVSTPAGWTLEGQITGLTDGNTGGYTTTLGADTGNCNLYVYSTTALGTETGTLLVSVGTNNVCWAQIYQFKKMSTANWSLSSTTGKQTTANATYLMTGASDPGLGVNDAVMIAQVNPTDIDTPPQWTYLSVGAANASAKNLFVIQEADSTAGNDIGGFVAYGVMQNGPTAGNPGLAAQRGGTVTNSTRGPAIILKIGTSSASPILTFGWDM